MLFVSHAGSDAEAARQLSSRLRHAPDFLDSGQDIWIDIEKLAPGDRWQTEIATAIDQCTAAVIVVGSNGIINWVKAEFDLLNSRAVKEKNFRLIPVLLGDIEARTLPAFAQRFQAVRDPLNNDEELAKLIAAIVKGDGDAGRAALTATPFPGLTSMDESWSDRFFGRTNEVDDLLSMLRKQQIVSIISDSGAGKSSLAMAGLGAAWRGSAFEAKRPHADDDAVIWNVVTMRPKRHPFEELKKAVTTAGKRAGLSPAEQAEIRGLIKPSDPREGLYALALNQPIEKVRTLLIIDQAEELVTTADNPEIRESFGRYIAELANNACDELRVVLTLRADYANLARAIEGLGDHLAVPDATMRLRIPSGDNIEAIVRGPLRLAGFSDDAQIQQLSDLIQEDLSERPGDMALVQMALHLTWRENKGSLPDAYRAIGRLFGALGNEADRVARDELCEAEREALMPIFIRLLRIDEGGSATRRVAPKTEFSHARQQLIDKLAGDGCGRLLQLTEETVEIAHESLLTQWPQLHQYVRDEDQSLRSLGRLSDSADRWQASGERRGFLAKKVELDDYHAIVANWPTWLSATEETFLRKSRQALELSRAVFATACTLLLFLTLTTGFSLNASKTNRALAGEALEQAGIERRASEEAQAITQALLARTYAESDPSKAIKLVLSAWPQDEEPSREFAEITKSVLSTAFRRTLPSVTIELEAGIGSLAVSPEGDRFILAGQDGTIKIWDAQMAHEISSMKAHDSAVHHLAFSPRADRFISAGRNGTIKIWDAKTSHEINSVQAHQSRVTGLAFSPRGDRFISAGGDGTIQIRDAATGIFLAVSRQSPTSDYWFRSNGYNKESVKLWLNYGLEGNILQIACQHLTIINGERDLSTIDIAAEIGLSDPKPLTPCEEYDPPLPMAWRIGEQPPTN